MAQIIWSPTALDDIESIAGFIARDSFYHASLFVTRVFEISNRLKEFPLSGRLIPEINDLFCREILYGSYRIMYRINDNDIWITGVVHGARDWHPE